MSITFDHILASQGTQLTDEELQQLSEIVDTQKRERSILNGDIDFDRSAGQYQTNYWDSQNGKRVYIDVTFRDAMEIMKKGELPGIPGRYLRVSCKNKEPKQYRFIRLTHKRRRKVFNGLDQLRATANNSNYIDLPTAQETLETLEEKIAKLRKFYEEAAKKLVARLNKKNGVKTC